MGMKRIFFIVIAIFSSYHAEAQTLGQVHLADSLHSVYDFEQAKDIYVGILDEMDPETDTLLFYHTSLHLSLLRAIV